LRQFNSGVNIDQTKNKKRGGDMSDKADGDLVRRQNRNALLSALRRYGPQPRIELGRLTGLSPASVTTISAQLIEDGLISELQAPVGQVVPAVAEIRRGRPSVQLALKAKAATVIAVNLSGNGLECLVADFSGATIARHMVKIPSKLVNDENPDSISTFVTSELKSLAAHHHPGLVGIAVQGHADHASGLLRWSPAFAARDIALVAPVEQALGVECLLANDANMIAEGLLAHEPEKHGRYTACIFLGYGVGMGLIADRSVYQGATGAAAEFGHTNHIPDGALCMCGRRGCLEAYAGNYAIMRQVLGKDEDDPHNWSEFNSANILEIEASARAGQVRACAAYERAGRALGYGIGRMVALLNPARVLITGSGVSAADLLEPPLRAAFADSVVESLRKDVIISFEPQSEDLIVGGTISVLLREIDRNFAADSHRTPQQQFSLRQ
jgi:predicted NBD/HSP70 family sugar kinase